jgi:hypothetical protein
VSDVVGVFQNAAIGVPMSQVTLTLTTASGAATTCNPFELSLEYDVAGRAQPG